MKTVDWYEGITKKMVKGQLYSHKTIVDWLSLEKPGLSKSGYHWAINKLLQRGALVRKGYGEYSLPDGEIRCIFSPDYSEEASLLRKTLSEKYPHVAFTVFETVLMNSFLNHLVGQNTIFLQVEKESSIHVFRYFQDEGLSNLLYKPSKKDFNLYWKTGTVVITDMVSEAPLRNDEPHCIMLEKMLVDMCADKLIVSTFSKAELPDVFEQVKRRYAVDNPKMMRYARRRHKEKEIIKYLEGDK